MQSLPPFVIHAPTSPPEACGIAAKLGEDAAHYAGGTELLLAMKLGALRYGHLIDLKGIPGLRTIEPSPDGRGVDIGAAATYAQVLRSQLVCEGIPALADVLAGIGNVRIRTSGTLGGNLAFADPHSDVATIGLGLDAQCEILTTDGTRWSRIDELVRGPYETTLETGELLGRMRFGAQGDRTVRYQRFRVHERPAVAVCVSALIREGSLVDPRVVVGAAVPAATRCAVAETTLAGEAATVADRAGQVADAAVAGLEIVDDEEGAADYKQHLIRVFVTRLVTDMTGSTQQPTVT